METPDKIYLWETPIVNGGYDPAWHKNSFNEGDVEYIRKDALIEKLEKVAAEYKKRSDEGELVWQNMCGINEAIDILNKM